MKLDSSSFFLDSLFILIGTLAFVCLLSIVSSVKPLDQFNYKEDFNDYGKMHELKIIDKKTGKENRFNLF